MSEIDPVPQADAPEAPQVEVEAASPVVESPPVVAAPEAPAEQLPEGHVKVSFIRSISMWVHGVEQRFAAGEHVIHEDVLATIKQTHLRDAVRE